MEFYGKYRGEVVDVNDPEQRGRIRVKCPEVLGDQLSRWALPCFPPNTFSLPSKGSLVWVEFEGGDRDNPIWTGVFYTKEQWKSKFIRDYDVLEFIVDSTSDIVTMTKGNVKYEIEKDFKVEVKKEVLFEKKKE